ncbi:MAG TPA: hypothetical protein VJX10_13200, partial [Pseudonocardiaceae bacterium]|nr:hypothetical protein [Pseudonocardiaceae bacterium]
MTDDQTIPAARAAVLALHRQVNVIRPDGFFGGTLAAPVAAGGVVGRAARFHAAARTSGLLVVFTRFTVPDGEGLGAQHEFPARGGRSAGCVPAGRARRRADRRHAATGRNGP